MLINERVYFFACDSLWCVLTLLTEEIGTQASAPYDVKWSDHYDNITNWAFQEKDFVEDRLLEKKDIVFLDLTEVLGDSMLGKWYESIFEAANLAHRAYSLISKSLWLYYYYSQFLKEVLIEFEQVVQQYAKPYNKRYEDNKTIFIELQKILENELPSFNNAKMFVDKTLSESLLGDLNSFARQLGMEWRVAVLSGVRDM